MPAGWVVSTPLLGVTPAEVLPFDSPTTLNLTVTRTGGSIIGPQSLGMFTFTSASPASLPGQFAALGTRNSGPEAGTPLANVGLLMVPVPFGEVTAAPEPKTYALIGIGLIAIPFMARRRQ
jgi:PEP-CTERM motif